MNFWERLTDGLKDIGTSIADWTPRIIGALLILIIGRWIAKWIRRVVSRLLASEGAQKVLDKSGINQAMTSGGYDAGALLAGVVYSILLLVTVLFAAEALGVEAIVDLLRRLIEFLPLVVVALIILIVTAAVGNFLGDITRPWAESRDLPWVAQIARWTVIIFGVITAFDILGVGLVTTLVLQVVLTATGLAFAIAFGVGGIDTAKKWWSKYLAPKSTHQ